MRTAVFTGVSIAALLSVACSGDAQPGLQPSAVSQNLTAAPPGTSSSAARVSLPAGDSTWAWTSIEHLTMPPFVAQFVFMIQPEGPVTQLRCDTAGTMTLTPNGDTFSGSTTQAATCRTGGGFVFASPPSATPPSLDVVDGSIKGHSLTFRLVDDGFMSCSFNGVITGVDQGIPTGLRATGRCIIPGHPKSPAPLDPPPAGTSKTIVWTATRTAP